MLRDSSFFLDSNVTLIRHTKLKDDPTVRWREELVSDIILRQVRLSITSGWAPV